MPALCNNKNSEPTKSQYFDAMETIDEVEDLDYSNNLPDGEVSSSNASSPSESSWESESSTSSIG